MVKLKVYKVNLNEVYQKLLELQRETTQLHQEINRLKDSMGAMQNTLEHFVFPELEPHGRRSKKV